MSDHRENKRYYSNLSGIASRTYGKTREIAYTLKDPILPLLLLGVLGAAFFAVLVLKISAEITFGIVLVGGLTAFLETKIGNDKDDR